MDMKREECARCFGDTESACECTKCGKCPRQLKRSNYSLTEKASPDIQTICTNKQSEFIYVTHIVFAGIRPRDNVYEVKLLLAPEVDISTVKITVKNKNLRVTVYRPFGDLVDRLQLSYIDKSMMNELVKRIVKHCENFLIPESIDGDKVRAVIDNKNRTLILTAPTIKPSKALRRRFSIILDN